MNDETPTPNTSLADRAMQRLRKLAVGNGLEPAAIALLEAQEQVFTIGGQMEVSPLCETVPTAYPGGARGKDRKQVQSLAALQEAVNRHRRHFRESPDWVADVTKEILSHDSKGWGLEKAKVTLPDKSAIYAATEVCPSCDGRKALTCTQCHGQGQVICTQCQGQGRETCYYCGGRGENPHQPGQRCATCNGTRFAPCRFCQTRGYLPCPTCNGRRGTTCTACNGQGALTQEVAVTCGAETHFKLQAEGLPSGLRRGLDRIGIANLVRGHADIDARPPAKEDDDAPPDGQSKTPFPILFYKVAIPYAELRIAFGGSKKAVVSAVGKRCAMLGVPNFLDTTLRPWREKLHQAGQGKATLEEAVEVRALKEILALTVSGKGRGDEVRKRYPFGLSNEVINAVIEDMQLALNAVTLKTRTAIACGCAALWAVLFYAMFMTGMHNAMVGGWNAAAGAGADFGILGLALAISWAALNFSTRFVLQKRFPQLAVGLQQNIGKTGYGMLGAIAAAFLLFAFLSPGRPLWLATFFH